VFAEDVVPGFLLVRFGFCFDVGNLPFCVCVWIVYRNTYSFIHWGRHVWGECWILKLKKLPGGMAANGTKKCKRDKLEALPPGRQKKAALILKVPRRMEHSKSAIISAAFFCLPWQKLAP
jgi:hypothetical protein